MFQKIDGGLSTGDIDRDVKGGLVRTLPLRLLAPLSQNIHQPYDVLITKNEVAMRIIESEDSGYGVCEESNVDSCNGSLCLVCRPTIAF